jgi:hypothetical protein
MPSPAARPASSSAWPPAGSSATACRTPWTATPSAAGQAAARAAEASTGTTITWRKTNALFQTEASGTATAQGALFTDSTGKTCRFIRETAVQNGKMTEDTVKLCKSPQGWVAGVG